MARKIVVGMLLLALSGPGYAETGLGLSAGYPLWAAMMYDAEFDAQALFAGAVVRWKPSAFLLDAGVSRWLNGGLMLAYLDMGVCFDLWVFRFGLGGGIDLVRWSEPGWGSYSELGFNGKLNFDVKLGRVTVGVSALVPIDALLSEYPEDRLTIFAAQPMVNVLYWFGSSSKLR